MLAFRSEAHVDRWCVLRNLERGAAFPLDTCWRLAQAWYADRMAVGWRRRSAEDSQAVFDELGLTGEFWRLTPQ